MQKVQAGYGNITNKFGHDLIRIDAEKKDLVLKFDGYTVCPLKVSYGEIIMAEFNYDGLAPSFPLDPTQPRWVWWAFDLYMLQPMYRYLMLNGLM